ncbi:GCN5 family acetyltransferase [Methanoculleus taiwanensis]|uniref:GCN5 family acetyltransferase n=1 Tax=Methanoculleus taiwanensis TaxID=1550565 RepID=A0A498H172_9EURY|nr:GNAT family N-acetyltransferase [Methanoculleus taiwanensis]RXE56075.1 GCN5 family acetyltransferase [Methanoculleus taiwanensis]
MTLLIREANPTDAEILAENNRATAWETEERELDPVLARKGVEAVLDDPSRGFYLVAEEDGGIVGQCMVTFEWSDWRCGFFWWIQSVYVRKDWRQRGIFSRIYRAVEGEARAREDVVGLRLYVDADNLTARRAYRSAGMQEARYVMFEVDFTLEP